MTTNTSKQRRRRILRETSRVVKGKVVALGHGDVVTLAELRRALRRGRTTERGVLDLLGSVLRALCSHETIRVGGVLYVRSEELIS